MALQGCEKGVELLDVVGVVSIELPHASVPDGRSFAGRVPSVVR